MLFTYSLNSLLCVWAVRCKFARVRGYPFGLLPFFPPSLVSCLFYLCENRAKLSTICPRLAVWTRQKIPVHSGYFGFVNIQKKSPKKKFFSLKSLKMRMFLFRIILNFIKLLI